MLRSTSRFAELVSLAGCGTSWFGRRSELFRRDAGASRYLVRTKDLRANLGSCSDLLMFHLGKQLLFAGRGLVSKYLRNLLVPRA